MPTDPLCPSTQVDYSADGPTWTYSGIYCPGGVPGTRSDSTPHTAYPNAACPTGSATCTDPIRLTFHKRRLYYRKGVPNPHNPWGQPDIYCPPPTLWLLGEYAAHFKAGSKKREFRLFLLALKGNAPRFFGYAWEVDPRSPPSPCPEPFFPASWLTGIYYPPKNTELIGLRIDGLGVDFYFPT
jgi:hypothetical protein